MIEVFRTISTLPNYEISSFGRIKTKSRPIRYVHAVTQKEHFRTTEERFLKVYDNNRTGYKFISLRDENGNAINKTIHRLVAEEFVERDSPEKNVVNHIDGNKHNNRFDNLEWCTNAYNHEHATKTGLKAKNEQISTSKLNKHCIVAIHGLLKLGWSNADIARLFQISKSLVSHIKTNRIWKNLTGEEL